MQAIEKITVNTNWIPIVWVIIVALIAVLKIIDSNRLKGYAFAFFNKPFVEDEAEENTSFLNGFTWLIFMIAVTSVTLCLSLVLNEMTTNFTLNFYNFLYLFLFTLAYFLARSLLESVFMGLFLMKKQLRFYIISKYSYFYALAFILFILFSIFNFSPVKPMGFGYLVVFLFLLKFVFHVVINKKLIFSKLFYFILYICALEIAPLLILFKMML